MKYALTLLALIASLSAHAALTIGAYNIRNFDYDERYRIRTNKVELASMLINLRADVLSVEEINNTVEFASFIQTKVPGYKAATSECGGEHGQHLGFVYNTNTIEMLSFNEDLTIANPGSVGGCNSGSRPMAIALFKVKATGQKFYGMTVHLKSGSQAESLTKRQKQFEIIKKFIKELKVKTGVQDYYFAGDMNTTEYLSRGSDYKMFTQVVRDLGMVDLAANLGCSAYWWGGSDDGIEEPSLLDHVVATPGLIKTQARTQVTGHCAKVACKSASLEQLGISYESVSDHCPIISTIQ